MSCLRATLLWVMGAVALLVGPALFRASYRGEPFLVSLAWVGAVALGGALSGSLGARVPVRRALRTPTSHGAVAGAICAVWMVCWQRSPRAAADVGMLLTAALLGSVWGLNSIFHWWLLNQDSPVYLFGVALYRLRRGDRRGAQKAIRRYLARCEKDPEVAARRPIAERFLTDPNASLDVPTELIRSEAPAGRGTEPEGACQPAGRGTEPEAAPPPAGATEAGRPGMALRCEAEATPRSRQVEGR